MPASSLTQNNTERVSPNTSELRSFAESVESGKGTVESSNGRVGNHSFTPSANATARSQQSEDMGNTVVVPKKGLQNALDHFLKTLLKRDHDCNLTNKYGDLIYKALIDHWPSLGKKKSEVQNSYKSQEPLVPTLRNKEEVAGFLNSLLRERKRKGEVAQAVIGFVEQGHLELGKVTGADKALRVEFSPWVLGTTTPVLTSASHPGHAAVVKPAYDKASLASNILESDTRSFSSQAIRSAADSLEARQTASEEKVMLKSPVITNSTHQNSRADLNEIDTQEHQANVASSQISIVDTAPPRRSHTLSQLISKHFASTTNRPQRTPNDSSSMTADTVVPKRTLLAASDARSLPGNIRDYQGTATSFVSAKTEVIPFLAHTTDGNQFSRQLSRIDSVIELGSYNGDADLLGIQIDEAAENAQAHEEQKKNLLGMLNRYISSAGKLKESSKINNIKSDIALSPYLRETFTINKKGVISYIRSGGVNFDQIYNDFVYNHRKENGTFINNLNQFYKENLADVAMAGKRLVIKEKEALEDAHTAARSKATHQGGVHDLKIDLLRIKKKKEAFKDIYAENAVLVLQNPTLENYQSFEVAARGYATYLVEQDTKKVITAFEKDINSHSLNAAGANVLVGAGRKLGLVSAGQDAATYESNVKDLHKRAINDLDTVLKLAKGTAAPEVISAHMLTNMEHAINRAGDAFKAQRSEFRKEDKNIDLGKNPYVSDSPIYKTLRDRLGPICQSQSKEAVLNAVKNIITGVSDKHISAVANFDLSQKIKNSAHSSDNNAALLNQWATALAKGEKGLADEFLVNSLTKVEMEIRDHPDREWIVAQVKELQQQKISELVDQGFDTLIQSIDGLSEVNDLHGQLALIKADPKDTNKGKSIQAAIVEHRALSQVVERHLKKIIDDPTSTDAKRDSAQACLDRFEKNATVNKRRLDLEVNDALEQRGFFARYVDVISNWRYFIPIGTGVATALGLVVGGLVVGATVATGGIFLVVGGAVLGVVTVGAGLAITMKKANEIKFKEQRNLATTNELLTNPNLLEEKAKKKARFVANRIQLIPTTAKFALS